jgi:hypothetical protein
MYVFSVLLSCIFSFLNFDSPQRNSRGNMPRLTSCGVHIAYYFKVHFNIILRLFSDHVVEDESVTCVYSDIELLCLERIYNCIRKFHIPVYYRWGMQEA